MAIRGKQAGKRGVRQARENGHNDSAQSNGCGPRTFPHVPFSTRIFLPREMDVPVRGGRVISVEGPGALGVASLLPIVPRTGRSPLCHASACPMAPGGVPFQYSLYIWLSSYVTHRGGYVHLLH